MIVAIVGTGADVREVVGADDTGASVGEGVTGVRAGEMTPSCGDNGTCRISLAGWLAAGTGCSVRFDSPLGDVSYPLGRKMQCSDRPSKTSSSTSCRGRWLGAVDDLVLIIVVVVVDGAVLLLCSISAFGQHSTHREKKTVIVVVVIVIITVVPKKKRWKIRMMNRSNKSTIMISKTMSNNCHKNNKEGKARRQQRHELEEEPHKQGPDFSSPYRGLSWST